MKILNILENLKAIYASSTCVKPNGAILLGLHDHTPPYADHVMFPPMKKQQITYIIESLRLPLPDELLLFYNYSNGVLLFFEVIPISNYNIPFSHFSIYGIPSPRIDVTQMEPFSITIEDLDRCKGTPKRWLKFGAYSPKADINTRFDLFVDTSTGRVYSYKSKTKTLVIECEWSGIDECLCWCFSELQS